ncbi:unnamed protein product [Fusarium graminearum]|nr:unnamed protein product [Fusarium graminearum]
MATSELVCLKSPDMADVEEIVDVIAVPGISDHNQSGWFGYDSGPNDDLTAEPQGYHSIRVSLFKYDLQKIFIRPGIQTIAAELLDAVSKLEANATMKRNLFFICHDIGGTILKEALLMSASDESRFPAIASLPCYVVFDPYETTISMRSNGDDYRHYQIGSPSPHSSLFDGKVLSMAAVFLPSKVYGNNKLHSRHPTAKMWMSLGFHKIIDPGTASLQPLPKSVSTAIIARRLHDKSVYFAFHEPNDVAGLFSSIRQHLFHNGPHEEQLRQTFEFRDWDIRCNSVESMLCTFFAGLPRRFWQGTFDGIYANAMGSHAWSCRLLLSAFYDLLSDNARSQPDFSITWILVNFDARITSYHWLLSSLCELLKHSELPFTLIIINSNPLDLHPYEDCFEIMSLDGDIPNVMSEGDSSVMPIANSSNAGIQPQSPTTQEPKHGQAHRSEITYQRQDTFGIGSELLNLVVEAPGLYPVQERLSQLVNGWSETSRHRKLFFEWARLRKNQMSPANVDQIQNISPLTEFDLFRHIWLPSKSFKVVREQTFVAARLLCHTFHPLTIKDIIFLEQKTDYGTRVGYRQEDECCGSSSRTLYLLTGVIDVCQNEVQFRDPSFRDYFISEILANYDGPIISADNLSRQTHAQLAEWCLRRINLITPQEWSKFRVVDEGSAVLDYHSRFLSYAIKYWLKHAQRADDYMETALSKQPILHDSDLLQEWAKAYWSVLNPATRGKNNTVTPLAIFAQHQAESLFLDKMSRYEEDPGFKDMWLEALQACVREGNLTLVQELISPGLPGDTKLDDILLWCFPSQNDLVVREIMEMAMKQSIGFQDPFNTLGWAAYHGLRDVVQMLIPLMPEDQTAISGCTSVNLALAGSRMDEPTGLEIVTLLVNANYPLTGSLSKTTSFSALDEACKLGIPSVATFLARSVLSSNSDSSSAKEGRPSWFSSAIECTLRGTHNTTLRLLLDMGLDHDWLDFTWLSSLMEVIRPMHLWQCCKTLSSYAVTIAGDSESVRTSAASILHEAFINGSIAVLTDLLSLWGGIKSSEFPNMLEPVIRAGNGAFDTLNLLLHEGSTQCDEDAYVRLLKKHLSDAVDHGNTELARLLISKAPIADTKMPSGRSILHHAVYSGCKDMVDLLIQSNANFNVRDENDNWYPIHCAYDNPNILKALLTGGADTSVKSNDGQTVLFLACRWNPESVKLLLEHGSKACCFVYNMTELSTSVQSRNEDLACMLLECGADPLEYSAKQLDHPLLHTCVANNLHRLLKMLLLYNFPIDEKDNYGNTAFNSITNKTSVPVLETLKTRGASTDIANGDGEVPLCNAIRSSNEPVFKWLIEQGVNINVSIGKQGSILHIACSEGSLEMVKLLCKNNVNLSSVNHENSTPLHEALLRSGNNKEAIVNYLLTMKGFDVNHSSDRLGGCLNIACLNTDINVVEALLERNAIVDSKDKMGRAPIHFALYRTTAYIEILLQANATLETNDLMERNALHFAVVSGRLDVVTYVLDRYPEYIHRTDIDGWSPLMWAVRICGEWDTQEDERTKIMSELIARGANPHISGEGLDQKWTAYDLAYYYGHGRDVIDLLGPKDESIQRRELQDKDLDNQRAAKKIEYSFCDACLMNNYGLRFHCDVCWDFDLCFKCYRSQNIIHPKHSFTNPSGCCLYAQDPSTDGSSSDSDSTEEDTNGEEEGDGSGGGSGGGSGDGSDDGSDNDLC